jgi:membrane protein implicated in regulation of membrane protease activity
MLWWHWLVLGLALTALEMAAAGGFYVIFLGAAALLVSLLAFLDLVQATWLQLLLFSVFSIGSLLLFRDPIMRRLYATSGQNDLDTLVGEVGTPAEDILPGKVGRFEVRGTVWTARNSSTMLLERGRRSVVVGRDQLTLFIQPEEAA